MKSLRERWSSEDREYLLALFAPKGKHQQMRDFPVDELTARFGMTDGRIDLRGLPLQQFTAFRASDIDFSYSRSPNNEYGQDRLLFVHGCVLTNCRFEKVALFHRCCGTFRNCNFTGSRFNGGGLGGQFHECTFDGCNLSKAILAESFERCSFRRVNFRKASFGGCRFTGCTFIDCDFKSSGYSGVDLNTLDSEAIEIAIPIAGEIKYTRINIA